MVYYTYAKQILGQKHHERSIAYAQALTLAALYSNQNGMLGDSWAHLHQSHCIYTDNAERAFAENQVSSTKDSTNSLPVEAMRSFWLFQRLLGGIDNCLNVVSFPLHSRYWNALLLEWNINDLPEIVFWTKVLLRSLLEAVQTSLSPGFASIETFDEESLQSLVDLARRQTQQLENWRAQLLPKLVWDDAEPPSTNAIMASLRAEYHKGMAELLRPYLSILEHPEFNAPRELTKFQQGTLQLVIDWEQHAVSNIISFDRIGADPNSVYEICRSTSSIRVALSNPVDTLHSEFKTVLLLRAIRSSKIYPLISNQLKLSEAAMNILYSRTIERLSDFRPVVPLLTQDLQILGISWRQEDSVRHLELATILARSSSPTSHIAC
ncbi:hypothetical protein COCC4DRAFT_64913 [Bipolaris maydis ATCC 48331]|uniref:Transcription factor domain-containing protein n=2 Tax=Cochliobolus heterostrophus TaxID=5016 RepID=M2VCX5_COCH5|nr:uncharacterized protein COCC4DRAFT_64913 [Bipolaris maydis ATCC 48331]EMD96394.1 hypothetical protein COCHEDRAFT_1084344 [Bipolaris maydis C5]EMD97583.1 hypothetical protein COCHEDRAFT_1085639 [Bipolaris maydis C5]ENI01081.1 hypothetical protein COCC4DRAFT_64913 [Bipolaris maydis ATCC 48331]KAJ6211052.1 hypothetical protein PSV09DRAFT_1084344 [Bipolaris maydis]